MLTLALFNAVPLGIAIIIGIATARWAFRLGPDAPSPNPED